MIKHPRTILITVEKWFSPPAYPRYVEVEGGVGEGSSTELIIHGSPSSRYDENYWWKSEQGLIMVNNVSELNFKESNSSLFRTYIPSPFCAFIVG